MLSSPARVGSARDWRTVVFLFVLSVATVAGASKEKRSSRLYEDLAAKRNSLPSFHQEFTVTQVFRSPHGEQPSKRKVTLDVAPGQWRHTSASGSGTYVRVFDGENVLHFEEGGEEYTVTKPRRSEQELLPEPYALDNADWSKAAEQGRQSCGLSPIEHECVVVEVPLNPSGSTVAGRHVLGGTERLIIDTQLGLVLSARKVESIETARISYQQDVMYKLERMTYSGPKQEALFRIPSPDMKQVRELSSWSASKIKKQLGGKPAPELAVTDLYGNSLALSEHKGKTVLLDFWATWCGPCRADGPAIEKLYNKYGRNNLAVIGISVSEDRAVVEKFLQEHPHTYPIVLTTENEMPRPYQVNEFPTYIIIDPDGRVASAVSGQAGFSELRKLLKKAGLDTD